MSLASETPVSGFSGPISNRAILPSVHFEGDRSGQKGTEVDGRGQKWTKGDRSGQKATEKIFTFVDFHANKRSGNVRFLYIWQRTLFKNFIWDIWETVV